MDIEEFKRILRIFEISYSFLIYNDKKISSIYFVHVYKTSVLLSVIYLRYIKDNQVCRPS